MKLRDKKCDRCGTLFTPLGRRSKHCSTFCRFMSKVQYQDDGCWLWTGARSKGGYGQLGIDGVVTYAHRWSYTNLTTGTLDGGLQIDHLCRNRACVNPQHLEAVTSAENTRRGLKSYAIRETCKWGHDITDPKNVYTQPNTGLRSCRECTRIRNNAAYWAKKETVQ